MLSFQVTTFFSWESMDRRDLVMRFMWNTWVATTSQWTTSWGRGGITSSSSGGETNTSPAHHSKWTFKPLTLPYSYSHHFTFILSDYHFCLLLLIFCSFIFILLLFNFVVAFKNVKIFYGFVESINETFCVVKYEKKVFKIILPYFICWFFLLTVSMNTFQTSCNLWKVFTYHRYRTEVLFDLFLKCISIKLNNYFKP